MKHHPFRRAAAAALCLGLLAGVSLPVGAAYSDVSDSSLTEAVAVLSSLDIISGFSDGSFHPSEGLTRAQVCKLAILAEGHGGAVQSSAYRSLFSDVSSASWAAPYINLAYEEGLISGYGNGQFGPDDPVTCGQAVTILLHLLGYSDSDIGPFWPEDYMTKAASLGLLDGVSATADQTLNRGQAALMIYRMLRLETAQGKDYIEALCSGTLSEAVLLDTDAESDDGTLHTAQVYAGGNISYYEQSTALSGDLVTSRGTLLLNSSGKACGFLPNDTVHKTVSIGSAEASGITDASGATYAISSKTNLVLSDEISVYGDSFYELDSCPTATLYYSSSGSIDLVVASDSIQYSGVALTGLYEAATPNTASPTKITLLGIELEVADTATGLSGFAVGDRMTVVLDGSGKVAAAYPTSEKNLTMVGVLESVENNKGKVALSCGLTATGTLSGGTSLVGSLVTVSNSGLGKLSVYEVGSYKGSGELNKAARALGNVPLADNVKLYDRVGNSTVTEVELDDIQTATVASSKILYTATDDAGKISVVLLNNATGNAYIYGILHTGTQSGGSDELTYTNNTVAVENSSGTSEYYITGTSGIKNKSVGGIALTWEKKTAGVVTPKSSASIARAAFDGDDAVTVDGMRVPISADVQVYNSDTQTWTTLAAAKAYASTFTVYYSGILGTDAVVRVLFTES